MGHKQHILNETFTRVFETMDEQEQKAIIDFSLKLCVVFIGKDSVKAIIEKYQKKKWTGKMMITLPNEIIPFVCDL